MYLVVDEGLNPGIAQIKLVHSRGLAIRAKLMEAITKYTDFQPTKTAPVRLGYLAPAAF